MITLIQMLIQVTHLTALKDAIDAYHEGAMIDDAANDLITALSTDDAFKDYPAADVLLAVVDLIINNTSVH